MKYMMVLEDLETFTCLKGCVIVEVPDEWDEDTITDPDKEDGWTWDDTLWDGCRVVKAFNGTEVPA